MHEENSNKDKKTIGENLVRASLMGAGIGAAVAGDLGTATGLIGASDAAGNAAGALERKLADFRARLFFRTARNVNERAQAEGLHPDPEKMDYIFRQAVPQIADAATEGKRQMMEEVILNMARRANEIGAQIEAEEALSWISEMPNEAALVFSAIVSLSGDLNEPTLLESPLPACGLSEFIATRAMKWLKGKYDRSSTFSHELRAPLTQFRQEGDGGGGHRELPLYALSSRGLWLARWIVNNPSSAQSTRCSESAAGETSS